MHIVFQVLNFIESEASDQFKLSDDEKLLLITLAKIKGDKGIYPSIATLCARRKRADSNIRATINRLENKSLISKTPRPGRSSVYGLLIPGSLTPPVDERPIETNPACGQATTPPVDRRPTPPVDRRQSIHNQSIHTDQNIGNTTPVLPQDGFDEFFANYPRQEGQHAARKVWTVNRLAFMSEKIVGDVKNRRTNHGQWLDGFIPAPAKYLEERRWEDEVVLKKMAAPKDSYSDKLARAAKLAEDYLNGKSSFFEMGSGFVHENEGYLPAQMDDIPF